MSDSEKRKDQTNRKRMLWVFLIVFGVLLAAALIITLLTLKKAEKHTPVSGTVENLPYGVSYAEQEDGTLLVKLEAETEEGKTWTGSSTNLRVFNAEETEDLSWKLTPAEEGNASLELKLSALNNASLVYKTLYLNFAVDENGSFSFGSSSLVESDGISLETDGTVFIQYALSSDSRALEIWLLGSEDWTLDQEPSTLKTGISRADGENRYYRFTVKAAGEEILSFTSEALTKQVTLPVSVKAETEGTDASDAGTDTEEMNLVITIGEAGAGEMTSETDETSGDTGIDAEALADRIKEADPSLSDEEARYWAELVLKGLSEASETENTGETESGSDTVTDPENENVETVAEDSGE